MGSGVNCSYTNSSGNLLSLICTSNQCCDANTHTCSVSVCSDTTQSSASSDESINTYLFWVILASCTFFTLLVLVVSYAICRYRTPGCADAGAVRDRFIEENVLGLGMTISQWKQLYSPSANSITNITTTTTTATTTCTTTITTPSISSTTSTSTIAVAAAAPPPAATATATTATTATASTFSGSSSSADSLQQFLTHKPIHPRRLLLPGKKSMIPVRKPTTKENSIEKNSTTGVNNKNRTVPKTESNSMCAPSVKENTGTPSQKETVPVSSVKENTQTSSVREHLQRTNLSLLGAAPKTLPRRPLQITAATGAAGGARGGVGRGTLGKGGMLKGYSVSRSEEVTGSSRSPASHGGVSDGRRQGKGVENPTLSTRTMLSSSVDTAVSMTPVGT